MNKITSKDGTTIAYEKKGAGPSLILVDGALTYRSFGPMQHLAELLAPHYTVYTFDRRGRGESSNSKPYSVDREIEDIDALIDVAGGSAFIYGISSGACLALEASIKLGSKIRKLAMYEPPYNAGQGAVQVWKDYRKKLGRAFSGRSPRRCGRPVYAVGGHTRRAGEWHAQRARVAHVRSRGTYPCLRRGGNGCRSTGAVGSGRQGLGPRPCHGWRCESRIHAIHA